MTEKRKVKGPYKRPSRFAAIIPMRFDYTPGRIRRRRQMFRPQPLRKLFELRDKLQQTTN